MELLEGVPHEREAMSWRARGSSITTSRELGTVYRGPRLLPLEIEVRRMGGRRPKKGEKVCVHYTGRLAGRLGVVFDGSRTKGKLFSFQLGQGAVVAGFEAGVMSIGVGGSCRVRAAASECYGERGVPRTIPPNSPLVFDIALASVEETRDEEAALASIELLDRDDDCSRPVPAPVELLSWRRLLARWQRRPAEIDEPFLMSQMKATRLERATGVAWRGDRPLVVTTGTAYPELSWAALAASPKVVLAKHRAPIRTAECLGEEGVVVLQRTMGRFVKEMPKDEHDDLARFYVNGCDLVGLSPNAALIAGVEDLSGELLREAEVETNIRLLGDAAAVREVSQEAARKTDAGLTKLFVGPEGSLTRLHRDNHGAHAWLAQIHGRKLYMAFPPQSDLQMDQQNQSPIDPLELFTNDKGVEPHLVVLEAGETLLLPSNWAHFALSLEPSVTLMRNFWNRTNLDEFTEMHKAQIKAKLIHLEAIKKQQAATKRS